MSLSESEIQKSILDYLKSKNLMHWRNQTQGIRNRGGRVKNPNKGAPDILGYFPNGVGFAIEVKSPGEKPSPDQLDWLMRATSNRVFAMWSDNLDEVVKRFESYLRNINHS